MWCWGDCAPVPQRKENGTEHGKYAKTSIPASREGTVGHEAAASRYDEGTRWV